MLHVLCINSARMLHAYVLRNRKMFCIPVVVLGVVVLGVVVLGVVVIEVVVLGVVVIVVGGFGGVTLLISL